MRAKTVRKDLPRLVEELPDDESPIVESEEIKPGVILDYDANDNVVGIEVQAWSKRVPMELLKSWHFETE